MARFRRRNDGNNWADVRRLAAAHRRRLALLAVTAFGGALLEAMFLVVLTGVAMALVNSQDSVGPVLSRTFTYQAALGFAAGLLVVRLCLNLLEVRASAGLAAEVVSETRRRLSLAYLGTNWATQSTEPSGRLQEILTSFVDRAHWAAASLAILLSSTLSLLAFLSSSLLVDPVYTLLVFVAVIAFGLVLGPLRRRVRLRSAEMAGSNLEFANTVSELGSLGMEMQTFGVQGRFADRIKASTAVNTRARLRAQTLQLMTQPVYLFLAYGAIVLGVGVLTRAGTADLQTFGAVLLLMMRSLSYGQNLQASLGSLVAQVPFLRQIEETVARYAEAAASGGSAVPVSALPVEFQGVSFGYTGERLALEAVDLHIGRGEILGVVGPSGAGKSTFAQLLLGLRDPSEGTVTVGGVDLRQVDRSWWSSHVAFVAQEARLITGTVAENIRFFRNEIDDERLRTAAREANLLADIEGLPDGFRTHLGERGGQLSGGQRQRLSIARALAGDPELLMLDEPTSALDTHSEALIKQTLEALRGEVTVVIIAHRMSLLNTCDRILVIEDGRITGLAAPADLRASSAFYRGALAVAG